MTKSDQNIPVVIVGGGPVGLFLAICLQKRGILCKVFEKRSEPVTDSRSLGIHPVSLELFDKVGITAPFLAKGLKVRRGVALTGKKKLGEISFEQCPRPHNYVLICPQFYTERILQDELLNLDNTALVRGTEVNNISDTGKEVMVTFDQTNSAGKITCCYVVGCDGKNSLVRQRASIHFSGKRYPDTYIMGDFSDTTRLSTDAAVFLPNEGLIESFPLPGNMRRWVVKTDAYIPDPSADILTQIVNKRIGYDLQQAKNSMVSSFGVQHFVAEFFVKEKVILAGDAAHVVSPIGGQGMNLGWLGAWHLAEVLQQTLSDSSSDNSLLKLYSQKQKKRARKAGRRAEINMLLGRKKTFPVFRNMIVRGMINTPLNRKVAQLFTMRGLDNWWV